MSYSSYIAYFDESGDHGLKNIDPQSPIFALCGAVYAKEDYLAHDLANLSRLKMTLWGHDAVIFHSYEIRKRLGPFERLRQPDFRDAFLNGMADFFANSKTTLICAAVDKPLHIEKYGKPFDPYYLTIQFCLERLHSHLPPDAREQTTLCVFESRGSKEDRILREWFEEICHGNNATGGALPFQCEFAEKKQNMAGLQVADLAAYPLARHVANPTHARPEWEILRPRLRCSPTGEIDSWGLKVFPKN